MKPGEAVNIETDLLGKYVEKMLQGFLSRQETSLRQSPIDVTFLQKHGFL